jgi:hypothetical protein
MAALRRARAAGLRAERGALTTGRRALQQIQRIVLETLRLASSAGSAARYAARSMTYRTGQRLRQWVIGAFSLLNSPSPRLPAAAGSRSSEPRLTPFAALRLAGLVAIPFVCVVLEPRTEQRLQYPDAVAWPGGADHTLLVAVFIGLISFLWLVLSGWSGWGFLDREGWLIAIPLAVALVVREGLTIHSTADAIINFTSGPINRHSVVYPLLQLFFVPLVRDPQSFTLHMNGLLGALATAPLFSFVRWRTGDKAAALFAGLLVAVDPLVARMAPTDGPSSFILLTWFGSLAFLTQPNPTSRSTFTGIVLLGIAATGRLDGGFLVAASAPMIGWRCIGRALRQSPWIVAVSGAVFAVLVALQVRYVVGMTAFHPGRLLHTYQQQGGGSIQEHLAASTIHFDEILVRWDMNPVSRRILEILIMAGAISGLVRRAYRLATATFASVVIVLWSHFDHWSWMVSWHRVVPTATLQCVVAGIGAAWLLPGRVWADRGPWIPIGGLLLAGFMAFENRGTMTRPTLLNAEYDIVHRNLGASAAANPACTLLTTDCTVVGDLDFQNIGAAAPLMRVLTCRGTDCIKAVSNGGCFYYLRSASSLLWGNPEAACSKEGTPEERYRSQCLTPEAVMLETELQLEPVDIRTGKYRDFLYDQPRPLLRIFMDALHANFQPDAPHFSPPSVELGLFRVKGLKAPLPTAAAGG